MIIRTLSLEASISNELGKENLWKIWKIMKSYETYEKLMFIKIYCMNFMILQVMVCITLKSTILSLIIPYFFFVF